MIDDHGGEHPEKHLDEAMAQAVHASRAALGRSTPNPPVGAVVLDQRGVLVGIGATEPPGGRHAEVVALDEAGDRARGGTIVVTLEPCDHTGRTGPCTARILDAGVDAVVYAVSDPNPVAAGGAGRLAAAGLKVRRGDPGGNAELGPLRAWLHRQCTGRPLVTWKYGASLDGRVAAADGTSRWITGPESREHAHTRRAEVDALVVGTGTLLADDPSLTARTRDGHLRDRQPLACVMGESEVPADAAVRRSPGGFRHLCTHDPAEALAQLGDLTHVLVEGGPTVAGAFLSAGLVDEIDAYIAPLVLGAGASAVHDAGIATLVDAHCFRLHNGSPLGDDIHLHYRAAATAQDPFHPTDERTT